MSESSLINAAVLHAASDLHKPLEHEFVVLTPSVQESLKAHTMDHSGLTGDLVLETLLKTNRPPTDEEKAIIHESMAPTKAKLKVVEMQISDTMSHIQSLKHQVEQAEIKLQRLRDEQVVILETSKDHRRVLSTIRILPEDVLREICIDCVETSQPLLSYRHMPLPYVLAQVSSGMRRIVLETPIIWASMCVQIDSSCFGRFGDQVCTMLAQRIRQWFDRAVGKDLNVSIHEIDTSSQEYDPSCILLDALFSYSARWKELHFFCCDVVAAHIMRIARLTAIDVPMLQSVSICTDRWSTTPRHLTLSQSALLNIPTLKHLLLNTNIVAKFDVNWAALTSLTLCAYRSDCCYSQNEIVNILRQTKCLMACNVHVVGDRSTDHDRNKITLPFLKNLSITETNGRLEFSLVDYINAPDLEIFHFDTEDLLEGSLLNFFSESPNIWKLSLPYFRGGIDPELNVTTRLLRECPSLTVLTLQLRGWDQTASSFLNVNRFLLGFVKEDDLGIICPRLQYIKITGDIHFSLQTLQLFLEGKQQGVAAPNIVPWKRVIIDIRGIWDEEKIKQVSNVVMQKKAEGLDVDALLEDKTFSRDKHFSE